MKKLLLLISVLLLIWSCTQSTSSDPIESETENETENEEPLESAITLNNPPSGSSAIPKDFLLQIDYSIAEADQNAADVYYIYPYFQASAGSIVPLGETMVTEASGTAAVSFSIPDAGFPPSIETPYKMGIQLQSEMGGVRAVLAETPQVTYQPGAHTGVYEEWLNSYSTGIWYDFILELYQFGDYLVGTMTEVVESGTPGIVNITATIGSDNAIDVTMDGMGTVVGGNSDDVYTASLVSYGGGLRLECEDYYRSDDPNTARGCFNAAKNGTAGITSSILIPEADTDTFNAINGNDFQVLLCFDPELGEYGNGKNVRMTWNVAADGSLTYTISDAPAGEYAVILIADCDDDHNPVGAGDCFGIAGYTASEALGILDTINNGGTVTLAGMDTYTLEAGQTITGADIELGLVPTP